MKEPGLVHVRAAKADGRWENAYRPASEMNVPADYGGLSFPFLEIKAPTFEMEVEWSLEELIGYLELQI